MARHEGDEMELHDGDAPDPEGGDDWDDGDAPNPEAEDDFDCDDDDLEVNPNARRAPRTMNMCAASEPMKSSTATPEISLRL